MKVKFTRQLNREFWNKEAIKRKDDPKGAHSDWHIVELENNFINSILKSKKSNSILDIGCGSGTRTITFSKYVKCCIKGIDYSPKMIGYAQKLLNKQKKSIQKKVSFECLDIQKLEDNKKYDVIISCRCFINQTSSQNQFRLFKILHNQLKAKGSLIIAEGSLEGYERLNSLRKCFQLQSINVSWYNLPLNESYLFPKLKKLFVTKKIQRLGTYYFLSRVIHPLLIFPKKPKPNSDINNLAMEMEMKLAKNYDNSGFSLELFGAHLLIHFLKK